MCQFVLHHKFCELRKVCLYLAIAMLIASCQNNDACPEQICKCPSPQIVPQNIDLNQLDADTKERLKAEILAEIKDDMRAEWKREFDAEVADDVPNQPEHETIAQETVRPLVPHAAHAHLPPTQKIERDAGGMKILRHMLTTEIIRRLPVDERESFSISDSSVFCFVEISAADAEDRMITIKFTHSTGLSQSYSLPVSQSPAWRTWSKLNLTKSMTGTWLCEVFNEDNTLLASKSFVVVDQ